MVLQGDFQTPFNGNPSLKSGLLRQGSSDDLGTCLRLYDLCEVSMGFIMGYPIRNPNKTCESVTVAMRNRDGDFGSCLMQTIQPKVFMVQFWHYEYPTMKSWHQKPPYIRIRAPFKRSRFFYWTHGPFLEVHYTNPSLGMLLCLSPLSTLHDL